MKSDWLDKFEFSRESGWSLRTIELKRKRGELRWREGKQKSANGKPIPDFHVSGLPPAAQMRLAQSRLGNSALIQLPMAIIPHPDSHVDKQISMFAPMPEIPREQRALLTPEQNEEARRRLNIISPLLEFSRKSNGHKPVCKLVDGREIRCREELVRYIATERGVSRASIWRWYGRYKDGGYPALSDNVRSDKGSSRFFQEHQAAADFVQAKYLGERLSFRCVHEALLREWKGPANEAPSYGTVRAYLTRQVPRPFSIMAREGEREFHERCAPYLITDYKSLRVNQEWVSDHVVHDVWVRNDGFFPGKPRDAKMRPWMTAILDMRSRKCVGAVWCASPSSHSISSALRIAITRYGIPETFYIDNGKDFEAIGRIDFSTEASGVLHRLGIEPKYCIPKHPQSKLIEPWFGTMHKRFDAWWSPFYCGSSPAKRLEDCDLAQKEHEKAIKIGRPDSSPLPPASEFVSLAQQWIEEYNANHSHSGRGMDGKTPDEIFAEYPQEQRRPLPPGDYLTELFWQRDKRRVTEGGCVQIFNQRYEPADERSSVRLFMEIERDIFVACDPANLGEALALDLDGRVIGRLRCQKLVARGPISRDDVRAGMRKQRLVRRVVKDYIDHVSGCYETELDQLRKRAPKALPAPPEIFLPRKAVGQAMHIEDIVKQFLETE